MGVEIERKFLVRDATWRASVEDETRILQGYLVDATGITVRVRRRDGSACLTIKGTTRGISRAEFEYPIPVEDAETMLSGMAVSPLIEKVRYRVRHGARIWEVDVFGGDNAGLVLAELELTREDEPFERPGWLGEEVSGDPRYYNASLAKFPYRSWFVTRSGGP